MGYLLEDEKETAICFLRKAAEIAKKSTCLRSKCGAVIVKNGTVIGEGFNSPPLDKEENRRCNFSKGDYHKKITDKTCCIHAEQRAVFEALKKNPEKLSGATIYFARLNAKEEIAFSGKPYCTICSKTVLDVGIKYFVLWHEKGICSYETTEYNELSFGYNE